MNPFHTLVCTPQTPCVTASKRRPARSFPRTSLRSARQRAEILESGTPYRGYVFVSDNKGKERPSRRDSQGVPGNSDRAVIRLWGIADWSSVTDTSRGGEYVTAAKMVSENLPTRMNVTRGRGQGRRECRRWCRGPAETQMHALNECRKTRDAQIRRHNWVCKEICEQVLAGDPTATVLSEHRVTVNGEEYRPDLVIVRGCQATVADVAVCYDNRGDRLRARYHEKLRKYEVLRDSLRAKLSDGQVITPQRVISDVAVDSFVIGTRGLMLPETCRRPLERLGIKGDNFMRRVQEGVIRGSVMVWRTFTTC